jgi:hypothetical protein
MKRSCLAGIGLVTWLLIGFSGIGIAEEKTEILYTSPSGAFRLELSQPEAEVTAKDPDALGDVWLVSTKDPTQRAKLPKQSVDSPYDDEFHFSRNEKWLFGLRHVGSGLRYGNLYQIMTPLKIEKR